MRAGHVNMRKALNSMVVADISRDLQCSGGFDAPSRKREKMHPISAFQGLLYARRRQRLQGSCGNRRKVFAGHGPYPYIARLFS